MSDLCLLKYPGSSLIDFHISTDKLSRLLLKRVPLFNSRFKAVKAKDKEAFIMQCSRPFTKHVVMIPVIRTNKGQLCPTFSAFPCEMVGSVHQDIKAGILTVKSKIQPWLTPCSLFLLTRVFTDLLRVLETAHWVGEVKECNLLRKASQHPNVALEWNL